MKSLIPLFASLVLAGCTVSGGTDDRFQRTGFPGIFDPSVTIILDTKTDQVYVIGAGALADGALASALRRPSRMTSVLSGGNANADASSDSSSSSSSSSEASGSGDGDGEGEGHHPQGNHNGWSN